MKKIERLEKIKQITSEGKFISIREIAKNISISESTIRRDLNELEKQNLILRIQGDIIWKSGVDNYLENLYNYRTNSNIEIKNKLGAYASSLIEENDFVFFDTGTTIFELAKDISYNVKITAVTNDLSIALELRKRSNITTIVLGGIIQNGTTTLIGSLSEQNIKSMRFNKIFVSPGAINKEGDLMFFNIDSLPLRKKAIELSEELIILADHSKFNHNGFITFATLKDSSVLITDSESNIKDINIPDNVKVVLL